MKLRLSMPISINMLKRSEANLHYLVLQINGDQPIVV